MDAFLLLVLFSSLRHLRGGKFNLFHMNSVHKIKTKAILKD